MLSIEKCNKILGKNLKEDEVNRIRDILYKFAEILLEDYIGKSNKVDNKLYKES
jgi:hypothetical protein